MTRLEAHKMYNKIVHMPDDKDKSIVLRRLIQTDPFFRLNYVLNIVPSYIIDTDWDWARAWEVERNKWGYVDLWAREHHKTTLITINGTIGEILNHPNHSTCVFSYTRPLAKKMIAPIIQEFENNNLLKMLFPDILWEDPRRQAPKWSENEGYVLKRKYHAKEPTILSSGLVDGQPTGMHFTDLRYDDVETVENARSPDLLEKTDDALRMSYNLGVTRQTHRSWVGTIYTYNDIYTRLIKTGTAKPRIYPATKNGKEDGEPWLWTREQLALKIKDYGPYISSCQLFLNPSADSEQVISPDWWRTWRADRFNGLNIYILVDPASEQKKTSDYTAMTVIGLGADRNYYVIRQVRDRLNLRQRINVLFSLVDMYHPISVGYEKYGLQADIEYANEQMMLRNFRFSIVPLGGGLAKNDRIRRLFPALSEGRFYFPENQPYQQYDKTTVDLTSIFYHDEFLAFPFSEHDDMLDSLSRIMDPDLAATFPQGNPIDPLELEMKEETYDYLWSGLR